MGKSRAGFRAIIAQSATDARAGSDVNLVGNIAEWPDTRLEFHVKVSETPPERRRQSSLKVPGPSARNDDATSEYSETSDAASVVSMSQA